MQHLFCTPAPDPRQARNDPGGKPAEFRSIGGVADESGSHLQACAAMQEDGRQAGRTSRTIWRGTYQRCDVSVVAVADHVWLTVNSPEGAPVRVDLASWTGPLYSLRQAVTYLRGERSARPGCLEHDPPTGQTFYAFAALSVDGDGTLRARVVDHDGDELLAWELTSEDVEEIALVVEEIARAVHLAGRIGSSHSRERREYVRRREQRRRGRWPSATHNRALLRAKSQRPDPDDGGGPAAA